MFRTFVLQTASAATSHHPLSADRRQRLLFPAAWTFIGAVSAYDAWLVRLYEVCILEVELNPMAWYLIKLSHGDVTGFLWAKALGTAVVLTVLAALYACLPRLARPVTTAVSLFQLLLFLFLTFA